MSTVSGSYNFFGARGMGLLLIMIMISMIMIRPIKYRMHVKEGDTVQAGPHSTTVFNDISYVALPSTTCARTANKPCFVCFQANNINNAGLKNTMI